ncbi:terminal uridylyltransferase 4-like [Arachis ipaensis]|uniref:terminal uridylyltransferase 4-like n=1 Tax=Arachis ipaensis TaxID=130454 RepID=UPI000A2B790C|nr:terminal uridylyltransferase 4-like [Arachis ipaensis]
MNVLDKFTVDLGSSECSCRRWQLSGIPCVHAISCIKFKGLVLEPYVADCYKREAYLRCYEVVIHPLNGPDLWEITPHPDVMPLPYRRPSHRPVKKRKPAAGDEEQSSHTHMSRKGEKQRCSICGVVGHNKRRCPKPIENEAQNSKKQSKGKQFRGSNNSIPPAAKGGKKSASTQPTPKLTVKRKVASATQPTSSAQSNTVAQPKRPRGRPKGTTKPTPSAQPDPPPRKIVGPKSSAPLTSSSQPTTTNLPASQPSLATASSQPTGHYSVSFTGGPHVSPRKLKLMAKLPPRKWGLL